MKKSLKPSVAVKAPGRVRIIDPELIKKVKEALSIPAPHKEAFWQIMPVEDDQKNRNKRLGLFRRRALRNNEIEDLKKAVEQSPGNTRVKIVKLRKKHPENGMLLMLSALCTHGMVLNSSNQDEALTGYKMATKEAATALLRDEISLYNLEMFFKIYFAYLDRFRRFQVKVYEEMLDEPRLEDTKREFLNALQIGDQLFAEKNDIQKIINRLKNRIKSSMYNSTFEFSLIKEVTHHIVNGELAKKNKLGIASETIAYIQAIAVTCARIPILSPVVDKILEQFPETHKSFFLRKISINSARNFIRFKMAAAEGEKELMSKIGKTILRENTFAVAKLENQSLYQPYETDAFFNLAFLTELSYGLYSDLDQQEMIEAAMAAMDTVISHDMSKKHIFTQTANRISQKLGNLKSTMARIQTPEAEATAGAEKSEKPG
ncbi:MAG: hypothetical protein HQ517_12830 [SAR324 cluster bacterium]|nr:hypothetical protein [SAR324 cluster bacterium]